MKKITDKYLQGSSMAPRNKMFQVRSEGGFGVRVLPSGHKLFIYVYNFAGKRRQMNLGVYEANGGSCGRAGVTLAEANRRHAEAKYTLIVEGKDPQEVGFEWHRNPEREKREAARKAEEERKNPTVTQLAAEFIERHSKVNKRESSSKEDERLLTKNVLPKWGHLKAKDIQRRDAKRLLDAYRDRPALCNNILKLCRKMFNFAIEEEILNSTPFAGVKAPVAVLRRTRTLSQEEIRALWVNELPKSSMSEEVKRIIKLILVTGQRPGEVAGMHRDEIGVEVKEQRDKFGKVIRTWKETWWTIPIARRKIKKQHEAIRLPHRVYLTPLALELIGGATGYIFPSPIGKVHIDDNSVSTAIRRNLKVYKPRRPIKGEKVAMVEVPEEKKMDIDHFTSHDLRRTCSTFLAHLGFSDEVNDAVLGHEKKGIVAVYNQYRYDDEKRQALEAWSRRLESMTTGKKLDNVVSLPRKIP